MRRRTGRQGRRRLHRGRAVPSIRRYLLCLRNDPGTSDTDSDSIPLSSLLDDDTASVLTEMNDDVGSVNPAVCAGLLQAYTTADRAAERLGDATHRLAHRMSVVRSAVPLFADHLQLPLFTGRRRWHTMFGQLNELTMADTVALNADEDFIADSSLASLFDEECPDVAMNSDNAASSLYSHRNVAASADNCASLDGSLEMCERTCRQLVEGEGIGDVEGNESSIDCAGERLMAGTNVTHQSADCANCASSSSSHDVTSQHPHPPSTGSQPRTLRSRRHSDPGSIYSTSTSGSPSVSSSSENWYYYDRRLRPGGVLATRYGRLRSHRSLSVIVHPPAYDDIGPAWTPGLQHLAGPSADEEVMRPASETGQDDVSELPPSYHELEEPPSYTEVVDTADMEEMESDGPGSRQLLRNTAEHCSTGHWQVGQSGAMSSRCSDSRGMFGMRPAVRWNRNTRVERWTSSFNWVMS